MAMKIITKVCVQTATYWGAPVEDGYGKHTFATPVQILVRWDEEQVKFVNSGGEEEVSRARVMTLQDVALGGYLFLGTSASTNPEDLDEAWVIKAIEKVPELGSTTDFFRRAVL